MEMNIYLSKKKKLYNTDILIIYYINIIKRNYIML